MLKVRNGSQLGTSSYSQGTRLRFAAMLLRRAMIIKTSTTNTTPATMRTVVGSIEALSLHACGAGVAPVSPHILDLTTDYWIEIHPGPFRRMHQTETKCLSRWHHITVAWRLARPEERLPRSVPWSAPAFLPSALGGIPIVLVPSKQTLLGRLTPGLPASPAVSRCRR